MSKSKIKIEITLEEYEELLKAEAKLKVLNDYGITDEIWFDKDISDSLEEEYEEVDEIIESFI
jgi:hypothetical protein